MLFEELSDVHSHSQLFVPLLNLTEERHATAGYNLPEAGAGDAIPGAELGLDLEVQRLIRNLSFQFLRKVEDVLDYINFSFHLLIQVNGNVDENVTCKGQSASIGDQIPSRKTSPLNMIAVKRQTDRSSYV